MVTARRAAADDTRRRLFAAALALFAEAGYHGATVEAIAKRAGVAKGTFFVHFATKDAVIVQLMRGQTAAARAARSATLAAHGPFAALRATVLELGKQAGVSRELSRAVLAASLDSPNVSKDADALYGAVLADMVADAKAARSELARRVDPETLVHNLMGAYLGAAFTFTSLRTSLPLMELLVPVVTNILDANSNLEPRRVKARPARPRRK